MNPASASSAALEQSSLLAALFGDAGDGHASIPACLKKPAANGHLPLRGLQAYRANADALAARALTAAYPVTAELLGEENFSMLAAFFWRVQPPQRGDMAQWGADLPDFLDAAPQLIDEPFLGDVARVEWALHCAATAQDAVQDLQSLALLAGEDASRATLVLGDGVALFASVWPVVAILHAHTLQEPEKTQKLAALAGQLHRDRSGKHALALVWRNGFKPGFRAVGEAEHALLSMLLAGQTLETALTKADGAEDIEKFDFRVWLADSVRCGLVTGARTSDYLREETS
ncbi:MAG: putative DNA-binding domain-containing protein [Pseudomonadota bacterium]